jgi:hypothetical protein
MRSSKYQLGCPIASRTDIREIGLVCEYFCRAEVAKNETLAPYQEIVRLNIAMANVERMDVHEPSKDLIGEDLDVQDTDPFFACLDKTI